MCKVISKPLVKLLSNKPPFSRNVNVQNEHIAISSDADEGVHIKHVSLLEGI